MSNSDIMTLLQQISARLARVESRVGGGGGGGDDDDDSSGPKPQTVACDAFLSGEVAAFAAACDKIDASDMGANATAAYAAMRTFVDMASVCYKPTDMAELQGFAKDMIDQIRAAGDNKNKARRTPTEFHNNAFAEALTGSINWTLTSGMPGMPPPAKAIKESAIDGAMFYVNKVRKEYKGQADHDAWVKALLKMLNALMAYAKEWHKAGLTWSFKAQGAKPCSEYAGSAAPTAPAAKKTEAAPAPVAETKTDAKPKVNNAMARGNLFAQIGQIDQSSGRTAGLKQVKKDANGKKYVADDQSTKMNAAKKARLAKMRGGGGAAKKKVAAAVKAPICELRGKKWAIENQVGMVSVDADKCSIKHNVYIYNCKGATIQILGKVNGITVDKCTKTNVVFTDVMGGCELVNCKQTKVQANGTCATVAIDKTDGCVVYAGRKCFETVTVVASKSSEMNISWPGATDEDAWLEAPIPEQYQHHIVNGKVTCDVSDLYTH